MKNKTSKWVWIVALILMLLAVFYGYNQAEPVSKDITWTAVGDDNYEGTASFYNIRWSQDSTELVNDFEGCAGCIGGIQPDFFPDTVGTTEAFIIEGLEPNSIYFCAIKTADEVLNWSDMSNIVRLETPDTEAPGIITDLMEIL